MPRRIPISNLNASTIDILNTIRANLDAEYQSSVPEVLTARDIPAVGDAINGYPGNANKFLTALLNRIALVKIKSMTFNNPYAMFKKGYLETGETIEEVFVQIAKAREFNVEKAEAREFKRTIPDVRSAFHIMNWRVQYPVTIQRRDLQQAFVSLDGVTMLINKIVDSIYQGAEVDEMLLFKYLLIKAITHGKAYPIAFDATSHTAAAVEFRGYSNLLEFPSSKYNAAGVTTVTKKADQYIFMDAKYNASYDVNVLASAFNMDKAEFMGKLVLVDDWASFDNERFEEIRANSDQIEEVTAAELALMSDVKAVLVDAEWFQVYDNLTEFSETFVGSGLYWNYWLNIWKTVSSSPFSNMLVFVDDGATVTLPASYVFDVESVQNDGTSIIVTLVYNGSASLQPSNYNFVQTEDNAEDMIAVHKYGAIIIPVDESLTTTTLKLNVGSTGYTCADITIANLAAGGTLTFTKDA